MLGFFQSFFKPSQSEVEKEPLVKPRKILMDFLLTRYTVKTTMRSNNYVPYEKRMEVIEEMPRFISLADTRYDDSTRPNFKITNEHVLYILRREYTDTDCGCHYDDYSPCELDCTSREYSNFEFYIFQTMVPNGPFKTMSYSIDPKTNARMDPTADVLPFYARTL